MLDAEQLRQRKPVWLALSELWLDTELQQHDFERIARTMADSGFSMEQLREIYLVEVAPVASSNLLQIAGEWCGFDEEWLFSRILRNLRRRPRLTRFRAWFPLTRWALLFGTERYWRRLVPLVTAYRAGR